MRREEGHNETHLQSLRLGGAGKRAESGAIALQPQKNHRNLVGEEETSGSVQQKLRPSWWVEGGAEQWRGKEGGKTLG